MEGRTELDVGGASTRGVSVGGKLPKMGGIGSLNGRPATRREDPIEPRFECRSQGICPNDDDKSLYGHLSSVWCHTVPSPFARSRGTADVFCIDHRVSPLTEADCEGVAGSPRAEHPDPQRFRLHTIYLETRSDNGKPASPTRVAVQMSRRPAPSSLGHLRGNL